MLQGMAKLLKRLAFQIIHAYSGCSVDTHKLAQLHKTKQTQEAPPASTSHAKREQKAKDAQPSLLGSRVLGLRGAHERLQAHIEVRRARVPQLACTPPVLRRWSSGSAGSKYHVHALIMTVIHNPY